MAGEAVRDVLSHRAVEEEHVLADEADRRDQRVLTADDHVDRGADQGRWREVEDLVRHRADRRQHDLAAVRAGVADETEQRVQYDLYLDHEHIGGISAIGDAMTAWAVGHRFLYPYQGEKREFIVDQLTPENGRMRADLRRAQMNMAQ